MQSENESDTLRSWDALYHSYRLHAQCDDGAASEGYSESVARMLVDHWKTLHRLSQLAAKDKNFKKFVIGHVDSTDNMNDVRRIRTNAIHHCPSDLKGLCHELRVEAEFAIKDDASVSNH